MNTHTVKSGGFAGLAFIVLVVVTVVLLGQTPDNSVPASAIAAYTDAHRTGWLVAGWLGILSNAFFIWFAVGLYRWQIASAANDEGLALFGFVNGAIATALATMGSIINMTIVFHTSADLGTQAVRALYDLYSVGAALTLGISAFFFFGVSASGLRHGSLPGWLCWIGYLAAIGMLVASLSANYIAGALVLGGLPAMLIGYVPFIVWFLAAAIVLIGKGSSAPLPR
jgi:hypothetical protein